MKIERLSETNITDFLSLFDEGGCKDCYCTALYSNDWDEYDPRSPANRTRRMALVAGGGSDGFLFYQGGSLVGWAQVGSIADFPNLLNVSAFFESVAGLVITCFKMNPEFRGQGLSSLMVELIAQEVSSTGEPLYAIPTRYSDEFNEFRSWTGTVGAFARNGFTEVQKGKDDYVIMVKQSAQQADPADRASRGH